MCFESTEQIKSSASHWKLYLLPQIWFNGLWFNQKRQWPILVKWKDHHDDSKSFSRLYLKMFFRKDTTFSATS